MWWDTHAHRASTHKKKPRMFLVFSHKVLFYAASASHYSQCIIFPRCSVFDEHEMWWNGGVNVLWKGKSFRLINLRSRRRLFFFYMHKGLFFNLFVSLHKLKVFLLRQFEMILSCVKFSICYAFIFLTLLSLWMSFTHNIFAIYFMNILFSVWLTFVNFNDMSLPTLKKQL